MELAVAINDEVSVRLSKLERPLTIAVSWFRRVPNANFGPAWLTNPARGLLLTGAGVIEGVMNAAFNVIAASENVGRRGQVPLEAHFAGEPRGVLSVSYSDVAPHTPTVLGVRLLLPRRAQGLHGASFRHADRVRIAYDPLVSPSFETSAIPQRTLQPSDAAELTATIHIGTVRHAFSDCGIAGHFVVGLRLRPHADTCEATAFVSSTLAGAHATRHWVITAAAGEIDFLSLTRSAAEAG